MSTLLRLRSPAWSLIVPLLAAACSLDTTQNTPPETPLEEQVWGSSLNLDLSTMTKLSSGVYIRDTEVGTGASVSGIPVVRFYYTGYLASGVVFDSNVGDPQPLEYGLSELIAGFNSGLQGMQVGGRRRLVIPSSLAYGASSQGVIPPNANLVFDIHLVGVL